MKTIRLLVFIALTTQFSIVAAVQTTIEVLPVDTSDWRCKYCVVEGGWNGEIEIGIGNVTNGSFKFGEYTGINENEGFFVGNATIYYRDQDASYLDLSVSEAGLDSRSFSIEGGIQGRYSLFLQYDEIPHLISDTAYTPYRGSGTSTLNLPPAWVAGNTTAGMTGLASSLQAVDIETIRKSTTAGFSITPDSPWGYDLKYRHDTREGTKRSAASFLFNSAQLIEPVDYVTDEVDASVSYNAKKWQVNLAYYGSTFRNNNDSLTWQNAFAPLVAGDDVGQLALPPDNQFNQFVVSAGYEIGENTHFGGDIAVGRMEQNDDLLSATQNSTLVVSPLPASSANAEVDTIDAKFQLMSMPTEKLRLSASYTYNDRDNKTPRFIYDWVNTDTFVETPRTNLPYSSTRSAFKLSSDYHVIKGTKLGLGYDHDTHERSYQDIDKTIENTLWGRARIRGIDKLFLEFKYAHAERSASAYHAIPDIDPPQNVLLSKYNMADRVRNTLGVHANITPADSFTFGLNIDISSDTYDKSDLGLKESEEFSIYGDVTTLLTEDTSITVFMGIEKIASTQAGSQTFSSADWFANNDDDFSNIGIGVTHVLIKDKLDIGADYTVSHSNSEITYSSGASDPVFPDLSTKLDSLKFYANYQLKKMVYLRAAYWYEHYESRDWTLDSITSDTIPNVLSLGEQSPSYSTNVVKLSMVYKF